MLRFLDNGSMCALNLLKVITRETLFCEKRESMYSNPGLQENNLNEKISKNYIL